MCSGHVRNHTVVDEEAWVEGRVIERLCWSCGGADDFRASFRSDCPEQDISAYPSCADTLSFALLSAALSHRALDHVVPYILASGETLQVHPLRFGWILLGVCGVGCVRFLLPIRSAEYSVQRHIESAEFRHGDYILPRRPDTFRFEMSFSEGPTTSTKPSGWVSSSFVLVTGCSNVHS